VQSNHNLVHVISFIVVPLGITKVCNTLNLLLLVLIDAYIAENANQLCLLGNNWCV
jgi:hypothetical protein